METINREKVEEVKSQLMQLDSKGITTILFTLIGFYDVAGNEKFFDDVQHILNSKKRK